MKKNLVITMFAALAMASCSNDEQVVGSSGGELGEPQFLTVNLVTNSTTRATGNPNGNSEYEAGTDDENKVEKVRFYFFDASGNPAKVSKHDGGLKNYLEWTNVSEEDPNMPNVEKILSATLIIQSPKGDAEPAQVVAIINPTSEPVAERSLTSLAGVAHNYQTYNTSGSFVMSNSVYAEGSAGNMTEKMAVSVAGKIKKTSGEALNDPVQIYVERAIAKVRLNSSLTAVDGTTNIFKTSDSGANKVKVGNEEKEIYVKFLGWNATAVSNLSRLVKSINTSWGADLLGGGQPWNWAEYFRSFWAVNADGVAYQYGAFVPNPEDKTIDGNLFQAQAKTNFNKTDCVYVNENATDLANASTGSDPGTPTKVIIAAQLVDVNGNPLEFADYGSTRTTISGLKDLFANNCGLYKKETVTENDESKTKFVKITPAELTIKTATEVGEAGQNKDGRYKVYIQLATNADNVWYTSNSNDPEAKPILASKANELLKELGSAKIWKDGYTYYYFDIKHLGTKTGVVRNHIYDANITKLTGLGTPVYNPEEVIYPEKPKDDEQTFIAAQINILSWRIVKSDVSLEW